ncbi:DUF1613-domain-containing protein [Vararia minispora EC-137]|uniref:DUF1613-domain-containing protein n=1 Tax=Vararia minispora EC-137 TaxID=1314806 RepID=A0ACB8QLB9_9AGAM|nr:DUF1613-domain-containing protein [Vararia minispora EC-137]
MLSCPADFSVDLFETATSQLIHHPEYNSTLILRSETFADFDAPEDLRQLNIPRIEGYSASRNICRHLLPRRPGRDEGLDQHCTLYVPTDTLIGAVHPALLILTPIMPSHGKLPYYHPTVSHLAFRYLLSEARLRIEVIPLPGTPLGLGSRLYRTCLALLETLHRYGWGARTHYRKRVLHDRLIAREEYQDLYLVMRERYKYLIGQWNEVTDPLKHVFEDIGIATFLMLLWKHSDDATSIVPNDSGIVSEDEPWKCWRRPAGGFIDLGCGNGLLTHILTSEGYAGHGIDLRGRTSWKHYPAATQSQLHVFALDPTAPELDERYFLHNGFLIGNHADELTPWIPILSSRTGASGYLSLPCCAWSFDARFDRARDKTYAVDMSNERFIASLNLGADGSTTSGFASYRIWLATLSVHCGWEVECETLRIPSTRNWAIVGRNHTEVSGQDIKQRIENILQLVRQRGVFKTRRPEGKAGDH